MSEQNMAGNTKKGGALVWVIVLVVLILIGFGVWKLLSKPAVTNQAAATAATGQTAPVDPVAQAAAEKEIKDTVAAVSKLILLPAEAPTLATILDAKKLIAEQVFYAGSQNGDKLLVYPKAQKAVIYSPSRNILVNVGPIYFNNDQAAAPASKAPVKPAGTTTKTAN